MPRAGASEEVSPSRSMIRRAPSIRAGFARAVRGDRSPRVRHERPRHGARARLSCARSRLRHLARVPAANRRPEAARPGTAVRTVAAPADEGRRGAVPLMERRAYRPPFAFRVVRARIRLFAATGVGLAAGAGLALAPGSRLVSSFLTGWDIGIGLYLALAFHAMAGSDIARIRRRAAEEDEGDVAILMLTVAAALVSLAAIFVELGTASAAAPSTVRSPGRVGLAILTIALSWAFIHVIFTLHYAHEFYDEETGG